MFKTPSKEAISFFKNNGWYISDFTLPQALISHARDAALEFYEGTIDHTLPCTNNIANDTEFSSANVRNNEFTVLQKSGIRKLGLHKHVCATAAALLESSSLRLFSDSLITKKPNKEPIQGSIGWHTDKAYWPTCSSDQLITAWIPLQDVSIDMGPLCVLGKSHLWTQTEKLRSYFGFHRPELGTFEEFLKKQNFPIEKKFMTLKAGQVSFHHSQTIHCSEPNISDKDRMSLTVHFQGEQNSYQTAYDKQGEKIVISYDKLCKKDKNGNPDYRDSFWFPELNID